MSEHFNQVDHAAVNVVVELGGTALPRYQVERLSSNTVISLDQEKEEPVNVYADGRLIARGELVAVKTRFWIRITERVLGVDAVV
ncbi:MAG: FliM/FliN family flagellar motor switch protein [Planctomycetota bacterium]|nr:FliM/FliN family flagellar motor switch protein [Planctomycetota bacterium]MEE3220796.1 FliM/FliN family flagellar motor switch protein [Planctomycetota bacterium]